MNTRSSDGVRFGTAAGVLLAVLVVTGCARHYTMTLSNGGSVVTRGKPRLDHGYYIYKDATGQEQRVNSMRVREISAH